jgi:hypothetical protein
MTADGQLVAIQRPDRVAGLRDAGVLGGTAPLGSSTPLGQSPHLLGGGRFFGLARRRAAQGAGVVVSGLVLSALALVATASDGTDNSPDPAGNPQQGALLPAQLGVPAPLGVGHPVVPPSSTTPSPVTSTTPLVAGVR